ncbi:MAG: energy-coupling factor transporter transmembrane protein EcfT [Clostridia bacterium]|nr:energy-coupling factor transporter transmembrane protein EcfT [Clostridia bacterium]
MGWGEKLFFQDRGLFLQSLHPVSALIYLGALLVLVLTLSHPLYLLALFLAIMAGVMALDGLESWEPYFKFSLLLMGLITAINALLVQAGETVIWAGPEIPLWGRLGISLEGISFGLVMGIRLLEVISIFCLYNLMLHPDKLLGCFSWVASQSSLVLALATRMFPSMIRHWENVVEAQAVRGVDLRAGSFRQRARRYAELMNALVLSSLEDSWEIAEAMQARGFGSGPRSRYRKDVFRPRDTLCAAFSLLALVLGVYGQVAGYSRFTFYPRLGELIGTPSSLLILAAMFLALLIPPLLSWGWQHWPYLRSKI